MLPSREKRGIPDRATRPGRADISMKKGGKDHLLLLLSTSAAIGILSIIHAYQNRSIWRGVVSILIWFILGPMFARWLSRKLPK